MIRRKTFNPQVSTRGRWRAAPVRHSRLEHKTSQSDKGTRLQLLDEFLSKLPEKYRNRNFEYITNSRSLWFCWWFYLKDTTYNVPEPNSPEPCPHPYRIIPTEEFLANHPPPCNPENARKNFDLFQKAAFHWEIARRFDRAQRLPKFCELPEKVRLILMEAEQIEPAHLIFGKATARMGAQVSLRFKVPDVMSISAAKREFVARLKSESSKLRIKRPKGPKRGTRFISWIWIAVMDASDIAGLPLNRNARKALSDARKESKKQYFRIRETLRKNSIYNIL